MVHRCANAQSDSFKLHATSNFYVLVIKHTETYLPNISDEISGGLRSRHTDITVRRQSFYTERVVHTFNRLSTSFSINNIHVQCTENAAASPESQVSGVFCRGDEIVTELLRGVAFDDGLSVHVTDWFSVTTTVASTSTYASSVVSMSAVFVASDLVTIFRSVSRKGTRCVSRSPYAFIDPYALIVMQMS